MAEEFTVLTKFNGFIDLLIKNGIYDENTISDLMKNIEENDSETKLERIVENMELRDPEDIDKFAILLRDSEFVTEEMLLQDECDSVIKTVKRKLLVRFKDLLSSPKACGEGLMVVKAGKIKSTKYGDVYNMTSRPRGFCVIIDNQNFSDPTLAFRAGSRADADRLQNVFTQLGFSVFRYTNQTNRQLETLLQRLSTSPELTYHDALAVIILSHGTADGIYGSDGVLITVDSILNLFNNVNCRLMINKPKMFFLSACRGHQVDSGTEVYNTDIFGMGLTGDHLSLPNSLSRNSSGSLRIQVPTWSDMFVYFSSVNGYASLRNMNSGSWFGYELAHALAECAHREHLHDLVTIKVGERLQERETANNGNYMKQAIETMTRGRVKKLYFNPGF